MPDVMQRAMQSYQSLSARVYQADKPIGCSFGDVEYYRDRLAGIQGTILEPAAGTGRIMIPLLQAGLDVTGFDLSGEMRRFCCDNLKAHGFDESRIAPGDMTTFTVASPVSAVIIPTGTFLLLDDDEKALRALACCFDALATGGRLLIDICLPFPYEQGKCGSRMFTTGDNEFITLQSVNAEIDYIRQVTTAHNRYDLWQNGTLIASEWEVFRMKWFGVAEFERLLTMTGFSGITVSADYHYLQVPDNQSEIITFEAVKL